MPGRPKTRARKLTGLEKAANDILYAIAGSCRQGWLPAWSEGRFVTKSDDERHWKRACDAAASLANSLERLAKDARIRAGLPAEVKFLQGSDEDERNIRIISLNRLPAELRKLALLS
ncbi:MAG: hypothetical protein HZB38_09955 [Planctomycetes bacterium]|nr:hypothetical protein [Planctomycetota bacterium]